MTDWQTTNFVLTSDFLLNRHSQNAWTIWCSFNSFVKRGLTCRNHSLYSMHAWYISFKKMAPTPPWLLHQPSCAECAESSETEIAPTWHEDASRESQCLFFGTVTYSCSLGQVDLEPKTWAVENNEKMGENKIRVNGETIIRCLLEDASYVLLLHSPKTWD